jgi:uncharacterized protein YoxC
MFDPSAGWTVGKFLDIILAIAFALWAWVLKAFGTQHIATIRDLVHEMKEIRKELAELRTEVRVVKTRQEFLQDHSRDH